MKTTKYTLYSLISFLAIPFTAISYVYFDWLWVFPFVGGIVCWIALFFLNITPTFSRYLTVLTPALLASIYQAYLSDTGQERLFALGLCSASFILLPFILFDLKRERIHIAINILVCLLLIFTFDIQNNYFVEDIDSSILRSGFLYNVTILLAILSSISCVITVANLFAKQIEENKQQKELIEHQVAKVAKTLRDTQEQISIMEKQKQTEVWYSNSYSKLGEAIVISNSSFLSKLCTLLNATAGELYNTKTFESTRYATKESMMCGHWEYVIKYTTTVTTKTQNGYEVVVPCVANKKVVGIIHLCIVRELKEVEKDLLEKASELFGNNCMYSTIN